MRKFVKITSLLASNLAIAAPLLLGAAIFAPSAVASETVVLKKTHMVRLPRPASTVIVGDPAIADVSVHSDNIIFLLGRGYGETDLLVLDAYGDIIMQSDISVVGASYRNRVNLINVGEGRESYNCSPNCEPSPKLGDNGEFISNFSSAEAPIQNGTATLSAPEPEFSQSELEDYSEYAGQPE